jgi:hypothetical protein
MLTVSASSLTWSTSGSDPDIHQPGLGLAVVQHTEQLRLPKNLHRNYFLTRDFNKRRDRC